MSILDSRPNFNPPIELIVAKLKKRAYNQFRSLIDEYETGLRDFWRNKYYTPQELCDALGPEASELFILHGTIKHVILSVKPEQTLTSVDDYGAFIVNQDGTITITSDVPLVPEPSPEESGSVDSGSMDPTGSMALGLGRLIDSGSMPIFI